MAIWSEIKDAVKDVSSLEVITFSGKVTGVIKDGENMINWDNMISLAKAEGEVQLIAATKIEFDRDTKIFIASGAPANLVETHNEAVENAMMVRQNITNLIAEKITG